MSNGDTKETTDRETIRKWAEARNGKPVRTGSAGIDLDFPGYSGGENLTEISWDEWFDEFEKRNLKLLYQEQTKAGEQSNFNQLVSR
jgi:hypothetical protein